MDKEQAQQIVDKILGKPRFKELPANEATYLWDVLKTRDAVYETCSFHILENRYMYSGQLYQLLFSLDGNDVPFFVGVEE